MPRVAARPLPRRSCRTLGPLFAFSIQNRRVSTEGFEHFVGHVRLGAHIEDMQCSCDLWSASQYRQQWLASAAMLFRPATRSAFVASVARGKNNLVWWPAWRVGSKVVFQNQLLCLAGQARPVQPAQAHLSVPPRKPKRATAEGKLSEWWVTVREVERFVREAPNPSIERTSQRPLRALCAAAHVER